MTAEAHTLTWRERRGLCLSAAGGYKRTQGADVMRYLISFDDGSMDHIPDSDWPEVGEAARTVVREAKAAGVWIFGCGLLRQQATIVGTDGASAPGPFPDAKAVVGGFSIIEVPTREEALGWAARIAKSCRCAQEVREIMFDPES